MMTLMFSSNFAATSSKTEERKMNLQSPQITEKLSFIISPLVQSIVLQTNSYGLVLASQYAQLSLFA